MLSLMDTCISSEIYFTEEFCPRVYLTQTEHIPLPDGHLGLFNSALISQPLAKQLEAKVSSLAL